MKYLLFTFIVLVFNGCSVGHQDWVNSRNKSIGSKILVPLRTEPHYYKDAGQLRRSDFLVVGEGLTHITEDKNGNIVYHHFLSEVLPNFRGKKKWIGKCLTYQVIDPETMIILNWGYDEGGNPQSCRTWP